MPNWAKVVTLIIGLGGWIATVAVTLFQGKIPDVATLGIPALLITALAPAIRIGRSRAGADTPGGAPGADDEGNEA